MEFAQWCIHRKWTDLAKLNLTLQSRTECQSKTKTITIQQNVSISGLQKLELNQAWHVVKIIKFTI